MDRGKPLTKQQNQKHKTCRKPIFYIIPQAKRTDRGKPLTETMKVNQEHKTSR